jgi:hypothetical protein
MSMRAFVVASLALALAWAPAAEAEQAVALIWKGSKNKADVESLKPAWERLESLLSEGGVTLPKGFPMLVESRTVRGLKPGFWVWVVGFCTKDDASGPLEVLKLVAPDVYARDVNIPRKKLACPDASDATLADYSFLFNLEGGRTLRILTHDSSRKPEGDEPGDAFRLIHYTFVLRNKEGAVLDTASVVGEELLASDPRNGPAGHECTVSGISAKESDTVEFVRHCRATVAECGSLVSADEVTLVTVSGDQLKTDEERRNEKHLDCAGD